MSGDPDTVPERVGAFVDEVVDWVAGLSAADCVGIGLALAAVFWIWASLRAATRLGPVIVEALEGEADTKLPVKTLTALLRERLAHGGLVPPPEVPGGAPQSNVLSAIEASSLTQAALIAQVVGALPRPRPAEYKIGGTLFPSRPLRRTAMTKRRRAHPSLRAKRRRRTRASASGSGQHARVASCLRRSAASQTTRRPCAALPTRRRCTSSSTLRMRSHCGSGGAM